ncbi:hypothetical protein SORBI_3008G174500 [Sorghum bicolor]|nr:hypothetical protein SORBI_3008G174500 [Sorghum bicolor]
MSHDNGPSEMGVGQPMVVGRKLLPPVVPGDEPILVGEKQYAAILRLRARRLRIKEARERRLLQAKKLHPRGPNGRFVMSKDDQEGPNGGSMVEWNPALGDSYQHLITTNRYQEATNVGGEAQSSIPRGFYWYVFTTNEGGESSTPGIGFYCPFITTNGGENVGDVASGSEVPSSNAPSGFFWPLIMASGYEENIGEVAYGSMVPIGTPEGYFCWPVVATNEYVEDIGESAAYGSEVPISNPAGDFCWPVVATNDDEENVGEVAYNSILNLESPDPTDLLRIMLGNRYNIDEVSEQFQNVARLQAPGFTTLLTVMNNAGYDPAADHGPYDVHKVMTKLEGW